jgi:hypothetical protein
VARWVCLVTWEQSVLLDGHALLLINKARVWMDFLATWAVLCYVHSLRPMYGQQRRTVGFRLKD